MAARLGRLTLIIGRVPSDLKIAVNCNSVNTVLNRTYSSVHGCSLSSMMRLRSFPSQIWYAVRLPLSVQSSLIYLITLAKIIALRAYSTHSISRVPNGIRHNKIPIVKRHDVSFGRGLIVIDITSDMVNRLPCCELISTLQLSYPLLPCRQTHRCSYSQRPDGNRAP